MSSVSVPFHLQDFIKRESVSPDHDPGGTLAEWCTIMSPGIWYNSEISGFCPRLIPDLPRHRHAESLHIQSHDLRELDGLQIVILGYWWFLVAIAIADDINSRLGNF